MDLLRSSHSLACVCRADDQAARVHTRPTLIRKRGDLTDVFLVHRLLQLPENTVFVSRIWTAGGGIVVNSINNNHEYKTVLLSKYEVGVGTCLCYHGTII